MADSPNRRVGEVGRVVVSGQIVEDKGAELGRYRGMCATEKGVSLSKMGSAFPILG